MWYHYFGDKSYWWGWKQIPTHFTHRLKYYGRSHSLTSYTSDADTSSASDADEDSHEHTSEQHGGRS